MSHSFPLFAVTTEIRLLARIRDTETTVLQLVEEKVLINAEVVQFSRTVGFALEDAKGKMMEKVAEVVDANDRKRSRSTADIDGDDDEDVAKKRVKQEEESDKDSDNDHSDNDDRWEKQRRNRTALDRAVMDILNTAYEAIDCEEVPPEWILPALIKCHSSVTDERIKRWVLFQKEGEVGFDFCLYGIFYHGHKHAEVARGGCFCRAHVPPGLRQRATKCIRVQRSVEGSEKVLFSWGQDIGPAPVLGHFEWGSVMNRYKHRSIIAGIEQ